MTRNNRISALARGSSALVLGWISLAAPQALYAQAFQGTPTVGYGTANINRTVPGQDTITLPAASPTTVINWAPTDTAPAGGPINFLPNGNTVNFNSATTAGAFTVLNRILPVSTTRAVALNGAVNSSSNVAVWFYSPTGLLIGSTANFNVGSLLLSSADLVVDGTGNPMPTANKFSVFSPAGSTSAVVVQAGAQLNALTTGQSNYIVAIAPRIQQDGAIGVRGTAALVAAESASFAVGPTGLFTINVTSGTTVTGNTFSHTGTTGGPDSATNTGLPQRVYMVAVPKNDAITMAISSSGNIGFNIADAANVNGNAIILSAGNNVTDTGTGNPIVTTPAGSGTANLTIARGSYTSTVFANSLTSGIVSDTVGGGNPNISFASNLTLHGGSVASVDSEQGTISVAGNLAVDTNATSGRAGASLLQAGPAGATLNVTGTTSLLANSTDPTQAQGGSAQVQSFGGTVTLGGNATLSANAVGQNGTIGGNATGGQVLVYAQNNGTISFNGAAVGFSANALGGNGAGGAGGTAIGGTIGINSAGTALNVGAAGSTVSVDTSATAGTGTTAATATPGLATIESNSTALTALGVAPAPAVGNIDVANTLNIIGNSALKISAFAQMDVFGNIVGTGNGAALSLLADNTGTGNGSVTLALGSINLSGVASTVDIFYNADAFGNPTNFVPGVTAGALTAYELVNNLANLQAINNNLNENYALGRNIDASLTSNSNSAFYNGGLGFIPLGTDNTGATLNNGLGFTGNFNGQFYTINNLYINRPAATTNGLFGLVGVPTATIRNVGLIANAVTGNAEAGGLVGDNSGIILNSYATGSVNSTAGANETIGGLVGFNRGIISNSYASGTVTNVEAPSAFGNNGGYSGGLVGGNNGVILNSYATANVASRGAATSGGNDVGGLFGWDGPTTISGVPVPGTGVVTNSYATGTVVNAGAIGGATGGLGGYSINGTISNSYWDSFASGQAVGLGQSNAATVTNLNAVTSDPTLTAAANYIFTPGAWVNLKSPLGTTDIDLTGGQGLTWRMYTGFTAPLLKAFMPLATVTGGLSNAVVIYNGTNQSGVVGGATPYAVTLQDGIPANGKIISGTTAVTCTGCVNVGTYTATLTGLYTGQQGYDLITGAGATAALTINPATLTIAGITGVTGNNKVYDTTTKATLNTAGAVFAGETVGDAAAGNLNIASYTANFANPNVGNNIVVNVSALTLGGASAGNYVLSPNYTLNPITVNITPAPLTVLGETAQNKVYDTTTNATLTGGTLQGVLGNDVVTLTQTGSFASKNVGNAIVVTAADTLGGAGAGNYALTQPGGLAANITPAAASLLYTANPATSVYGNQPAALTGTVTPQGLLGQDTLASSTTGQASFTTTANATSNVGTYAITGTGLISTGNYAFQTVQAAGNAVAYAITARLLSVTADPQNRVLGFANPALTYSSVGLVNGDVLVGALSTTATTASPIGLYPITQGTLQVTSAPGAPSKNYTLTYFGANLAIVSPLTIPLLGNMIIDSTNPNTLGTTADGKITYHYQYPALPDLTVQSFIQMPYSITKPIIYDPVTLMNNDDL